MFGINFPMDLDAKIKAVLIGACLLIVIIPFYSISFTELVNYWYFICFLLGFHVFREIGKQRKRWSGNVVKLDPFTLLTSQELILLAAFLHFKLDWHSYYSIECLKIVPKPFVEYRHLFRIFFFIVINFCVLYTSTKCVRIKFITCHLQFSHLC